MVKLLKKVITSFKSYNIFLLLKNCSLFVLKIYFKFNIRLLHLFTENRFFYLIYTFLVLYGFYGCKGKVECSISHHIAFLVVIYFIITSIFMLLICKIPRTRHFLDFLVGEAYVIKYLGPFTGTRTILRALGLLLGCILAETVTLEHRSYNWKWQREIEVLENDKVYGSDRTKMDKAVIGKLDKELSNWKASKPTRGIVGDMITKADIESLVAKGSSTAVDMAEAVFGKKR